MNIEKPLDALQALRDKIVIVHLKQGNEIKGKLVAFDLNLNLTLEIEGTNKLVQGNTVLAVSFSS